MLANAEQNGTKQILPVSLSITHPYDNNIFTMTPIRIKAVVLFHKQYVFVIVLN